MSKNNITNCDKYWRYMWYQIITFKCDSCNKKITLNEKEQKIMRNVFDLVILFVVHATVVVITAFILRDMFFVYFFTHNLVSSKDHECKSECFIHIRARK